MGGGTDSAKNHAADRIAACFSGAAAIAATAILTWLGVDLGGKITEGVEGFRSLTLPVYLGAPSLFASIYWRQRRFFRALIYALLAVVIAAFALLAELGPDSASVEGPCAYGVTLVAKPNFDQACGQCAMQTTAPGPVPREVAEAERWRAYQATVRCVTADLLSVSVEDLPTVIAIASAIILQLVVFSFIRPISQPTRRSLFAQYGLFGGSKIAWTRLIFGDVAAQRLTERVRCRLGLPPTYSPNWPVRADEALARKTDAPCPTTAPSVRPTTAIEALEAIDVAALTGPPAWRIREGLRDHIHLVLASSVQPSIRGGFRPRGRDPPRRPDVRNDLQTKQRPSLAGARQRDGEDVRRAREIRGLIAGH